METEREHLERRERPYGGREETESDTGAKDFMFGVMGIGAIVVIAIAFAIFSNI